MTNLPQPTSNLEQAKSDMDDFGYCLLEKAIKTDRLAAIRTRLVEQLAAEEQQGLSLKLPDGKQLVRFLLNKGDVFHGPLLHDGLRTILRHVLGEAYLLSSYHAHFAHPGGSTAFHTDQFWMPPPTNEHKETLVKPGSVTRQGNRGHHVGGDAVMNAKTIAPAVVCNAMWMIDDFTETNGATVVVPGSHLSGRQPDHDLDDSANWVPALGPAGTVCIFEGRTWHSTGENTSDAPRIGLTTNFCAPQFRQQENYLMGTRPEVLEAASEELRELIGFKPWQGYGGHEGSDEWVARGQYALGELKPD